MSSVMWTVLLISHVLVDLVQGQGPTSHLLKYINYGASLPSSSPPQFDSSTTMEAALSNTRNTFARADRICVRGMWALYNTTTYGEGVEDITTVISVRGTDISNCTRQGQLPILRNVQSLHYLGNADYSMDGVTIYSQPYFLGGQWDARATGGMFPAASGVTGFPLGSMAITGMNSWVICGDRVEGRCQNGICVNARYYGGLFMMRNPARDNTLPPGIQWPRVVRRVIMVTSDQCENYSRPNTPRSRKLGRRHTPESEEVVQVDVDIFP